MTPGDTKRARHGLWVAGLVLYLGVVWYLGWDGVRAAFARLDAWRALEMSALMVGALWFRALKWTLVLGPGQRASGLFLISKAAGGWSPGRVGELAPLLLPEHRSPRLAAWIVLDRLLETGATLVLGLGGLVALGLPERGMALMFAAATLALVVAPYFVLTQKQWFVSLSQWFGENAVGRLLGLLASLSDEIRQLRRMLPWAAVMTMIATSLDIYVGLLLYLAFGFRVAFALLAVVQCAHGLASAMPFFPNATGVPYLVAAGLLYKFAGLPTEVLAAAIGVNVALSNVLFWSSFGIGAATLRRKPKPKPKLGGQGDLFDRLAAQSQLYIYEPDSLERLKMLVPHPGRALDIGCGDGVIGAVLGADPMVGLELSPKCAVLAARRGVQAVVADATKPLPFAAGALDSVFCIDVLHHLHGSWDAIVAEASRVLKPGGNLVIVEPDARYLLIRLTQAPASPIRVAPYDNEPAIRPEAMEAVLERCGFVYSRQAIRVIGHQVERSVFPLWQRLLKAPFVIVLSWLHGTRPNKFVLLARKP